jgi:Lipocalin-like domain
MRTSYINTLQFFCSLLFIVSIVASCQKDAEEICTTSMASVSGTYKLTALTYKENSSSPAQNFLLLKEDCELDDLVSFNNNGTYHYQDEGLVCSPDGSENGTWSIAGNTIISDGIVAGTIEYFDCRQLTVYTGNVFIPGDRITLTITRQ